MSEVEFNCPSCDDMFTSRVELSQHVRKNHHRDQVCQTEAFNNNEALTVNVEYPCFYCEQTINDSKEQLLQHHGECRESGLCYQDNSKKHFQPVLFFNFHPTYPPPFIFPTYVPCYTCSETFKNKIDLRRHFDNVHPETVLFWCEVCLTNFGSDRGQSHMRNNHKGLLRY